MVADAPFSGLNTLGERFAYAGIPMASREAVEIVTIDDFVRQHGVARVDAIKLDIEGGEAKALAGAKETLRRTRRPRARVNATALVATGSAPLHVEETLLDARYRAFRIDESDASLMPVSGIAELDEQNIVFLPPDANDSV